MQPNVHGLWVLLLVGLTSVYPLLDWQAGAAHLSDLSASQNVLIRFPDLSASQTVALRFPDLFAFQTWALRLPDLSSSQRVALQFLDTPAVGLASLNRHAALPSPAPLVHLIDFEVEAALPPIGHSRFCLRYPDDCRIQGIDFRRRNIALTLGRWNELNGINSEVNRRIFAEVTSGNGATEQWTISPPTGDCKDYAITKRHELLKRGWPSRSLLLSEVVLPSGEHHLILVVRVKDADLVLDNLNNDIRLVATTYVQYDWVRLQSPQNPKFWLRVQKRLS